MIITRPGYSLDVSPDRPKAILRDAEGNEWSALSLVGSADRLDARDETLPGITTTVENDDDGATVVTLVQPTAAWERKAVRVICRDEQLEVSLEVTGSGWLTEVTLLGGRAIVPTGAAGPFRSSLAFLRSLFVPVPTEPVALTRPSSTPAALGAFGDADPGRLNGIFSPPPLCFALCREDVTSPTKAPEGDWLATWFEAAAEEMTFNQIRYSPLDGGFLLTIDYDAHTQVEGTWRSPTLVIRPVGSPWAALAAYHAAHPGSCKGSVRQIPKWWREPIFCGWGAQCARAAAMSRKPAQDDGMVGGSAVFTAAGLASQENYDSWLERLIAHDLDPGTVVLDDKWQLEYGNNQPDPQKWPDLKGWIAHQHEQGRRVLLWFKAWDPQGLPAEMCIIDVHGTPIAVDPGNPAYREHLARSVARMLGPGGLDADGFKVDFTQRMPVGSSLRGHGPWGIAGLHQMMSDLYRAAKAAKPDALIINHTIHPAFADTMDMVRLNDVLRYDAAGNEVSVAEQLVFRAKIASLTLPDALIDTDQWPMPNKKEWLEYAETQWQLGVPALYYLEGIDNSGEEISAKNLTQVAATWHRYRLSL